MICLLNINHFGRILSKDVKTGIKPDKFRDDSFAFCHQKERREPFIKSRRVVVCESGGSETKVLQNAMDLSRKKNYDEQLLFVS